ncbi:MAG: response regulator [Gammaproteobacteria bacterium]|nr:response regulator [Gammaproteobacteria bacterium]
MKATTLSPCRSSDRLSDETNRRYNDIIHSSGAALLTIINDILDYSKIEAGKMEIESVSFDLEELISQSLTIFRHKAMERSVELIADVDTTITNYLIGDPNRIKQIILNLISNALKFTRNGQVLLQLSWLDRSSQMMKLSVIDSGEGVPLEQQARLFKAFSQADKSIAASKGGTGLGLAICKQLAELMGGSVGLESELGKGSTFWVTIEIAEDANPDSEILKTETDLSGNRLLVVDDNYDFCELIARRAEKWGLEVEIAHNGDIALQMIKAAEKPFDLISFDLYMPVVDGLTAAKRMAHDPDMKDIPRVLLTSATTMPPQSELDEAGIVHVLEKPALGFQLNIAYAKALGKTGEVERTEAVSEPAALAKPLRILVAEDNMVNTAVIDGMLRKLNQNAVFTDNGELALEEIRRSRQEFDLVLMDIEMPVMGGIEATRKVREWEISEGRKSVPIIALSAHVLEEQKQQCFEVGMNAYLTKPLSIDRLRLALLDIEQSRSLH